MRAQALAQVAGGLLALTSLLGVVVAFDRVRLRRRDLVLVACQPVAAFLIWLPLEGPFEGRTLLAITSDHGLAAADLLVALPLTVVGLLMTRIRR